MAMRILAAAALLFACAAPGLALHLALSEDTMFSGKRPEYLGVKDGRLARCRRTPNCVSSQADPADAGHYIAPIAFKGGTAAAMAAARGAIEALPRTRVIRAEGNYLYAEFRSKLMGFVDDVELLHDERAGLIHVRSASRLGRRDFGVNRGRVEALRAAIATVGGAGSVSDA
jgi:uncharacterized protein (DUF1499 family)